MVGLGLALGCGSTGRREVTAFGDAGDTRSLLEVYRSAETESLRVSVLEALRPYGGEPAVGDGPRRASAGEARPLPLP